MRRIGVVLMLMPFGATSLGAQDLNPLELTADTRYYDYWEGNWCAVEKGVMDTVPAFRVKRSVHPAAFEEEWLFVVNGNPLRSVALRAWDKTAQRWMFTWVSDNGLYQVWEGRKDSDHWYIYRRFDVDGDRYLSRQGWLRQADGSVVRTSQKSYDNGTTWELRFAVTYRKCS